AFTCVGTAERIRLMCGRDTDVTEIFSLKCVEFVERISQIKIELAAPQGGGLFRKDGPQSLSSTDKRVLRRVKRIGKPPLGGREGEHGDVTRDLLVQSIDTSTAFRKSMKSQAAASS